MVHTFRATCWTISISLVAARIGGIHRVVCASPAYFAARGTPKNPEELSNHDGVTFEAVSSPQSWQFQGAKRETSVPVHSRLAVNTAEAAIDAAICEIGITRVLSYQMAVAERAGTLVRILRAFEPAPAPVNLVLRAPAKGRRKSGT